MGIDYYNKIKKLNIEHYAGEISYYTKAELRKVEIKILMSLKRGAKILDLGCGAGRFSIGAGQLGFNVIGIDITPTAVIAARSRAKINRLYNVRFQVGDMTSIPFSDNSFDYVFCPRFSINAVATFKKRKMAIVEMLRVARPDGKVFVESFNKFYLGKGPGLPFKNLFIDPIRYIRIFIYKIIGKKYIGLHPGDIIYKANKVKGASVGYAHIPTMVELKRLVPPETSCVLKSIPNILRGSIDPIKYFRYSIWFVLKKRA